MFTAKTINYNIPELDNDGQCTLDGAERLIVSVYLREWRSIEVWYPESGTYMEKVEQFKVEAEAVEDEVERKFLIDMHDTYKAFITYVTEDGNDSFYCIAETEELYITDRQGNTVYVIK